MALHQAGIDPREQKIRRTQKFNPWNLEKTGIETHCYSGEEDHHRGRENEIYMNK